MSKVRITTLLSLTGVLVAGSAAALVNTQVLGNPVPRSENASEITAVLTLPSTSAPNVESLVPTTVPAPAPTALVGEEPAVFDVGGIGTVTLDGSGDVLRLVSAVPTPGWTVTGTNQIDATHVQVTLQSLDRTVQFTGTVENGTISTEVEQWSNVAPGDSTLPDGQPVTTSGGSVNSTPGSGSTHTPVTSSHTATTSPSTATPATAQPVTTTTDDHGGGKGGSNGGGGKGGGGSGGGSDDSVDD